ncbi:MAG: gfo/Idh/MocA family oxidoreductase, partial [Planctomycetota bacterium]
MTDKKTGVGFIGCGGFAAGNHIPSVYKNPNMEIIGFCDLNEVQLKELSEKFSPKYTTTDMEDIFK